MFVKPDSLPHYTEKTDLKWNIEIRNIWRQLTNRVAAMSAEMLQWVKWRKTSKANRDIGEPVSLFAFGYVLMIFRHNLFRPRASVL